MIALEAGKVYRVYISGEREWAEEVINPYFFTSL